MDGQTMNLSDGAALITGAISIQPVIDWPRFILAIVLFGGLLGYMVYAWAKR